MKNLIGKEAKLPDGQLVLIEEVENGLASVRRIEGEWNGRIAVCAVSSLDLTDSDFLVQCSH
jgi:hypothetical protein